jgi:hypothetical protein
MKIDRLFVKKGESAFDSIEFDTRSSVIRNPDGSIVFEMNDIKVPAHWSQVATDIIAQKYFRKAGVPVFLKKAEEDGVPAGFRDQNRIQRNSKILPKKKGILQKLIQDRYSPGLPVAGHTGDGNTTTLAMKKMRRIFTRNSAICWQCSLLHRIHHSGLIQV